MDELIFDSVFVQDTAANATKAPKIMEDPRLGIGCLAHTINLSAISAISATSVKPVVNLVAKAKKLVTVLHKSDQAAIVLKRKQALLLENKMPKLIQECATRWNSTYDMLQRFTEQSQVSKF